jgi:hypothetical protein
MPCVCVCVCVCYVWDICHIRHSVYLVRVQDVGDFGAGCTLDVYQVVLPRA